MVEYLPWSKTVLQKAILAEKNNLIPTLDLELTAKCTGASCIYCDSKPEVSSCEQLGETRYAEIMTLINAGKKNGLEWVYTCGLGEPLEDSKFWDLVHLLKENNIRLSMFSNGVFIKDLHVAKELKENGVNIILKMDTFNEGNFDKILGSPGIASLIYKARDLLLEAGYAGAEKYTDLAFSIVPTSLSIEGIPEVVEFAKKYGIFASIGELEQAGEVINKKLTSTLGLGYDKVIWLKQIADSYAEKSYMRPICPCILTGIHIDNLGNCIVDEGTGLNCKWFLLKNPRTTVLGDIYHNTIEELHHNVSQYRRDCFLKNRETIETEFSISYVFGGCGGNPKDIITLAKEMIG